MKESPKTPSQEKKMTILQLEAELKRLSEYSEETGNQLSEAYKKIRHFEALKIAGKMTEDDNQAYVIIKNWLETTRTEVEQRRQEYDRLFNALHILKSRPLGSEKSSNDEIRLETVEKAEAA